MVRDWFSYYDEKQPTDKVPLVRPPYPRDLLTKHQKELIAYVMNDVAVQDKITEPRQRELIEARVRIRSPASLALAEIRRQIDVLDALPLPLSQPLISQMRGLLQRLQGELDQQQPPPWNDHVDDLLLFLRGLRLIDEVHRLNHDYNEEAISSEVRKDTAELVSGLPDAHSLVQGGRFKSISELQHMLDDRQSKDHLPDMVNKQTEYTVEVGAHTYDKEDYVKTYVEKCLKTLSRKIKALRQSISQYKTALQAELSLLMTIRDASETSLARPAKQRKTGGDLADIASFRLRLSS